MTFKFKFEMLTCIVKGRTKRKESKTILNSASGTFHAGTLVGLLGASGAGKTTLLNILSGYLSSGVSGSIYLNDVKRNAVDLKRISTYLGQDVSVQPFLTVRESLMMAARLKLGCSKESEQNLVDNVIDTLCLKDCSETRSENLSGGQRKRLSIGLELISDPSLIFLDEPTTGLDEVSVRSCVEFLKTLTLQGKMVICSIHQPSDSVLKLFDHLYFMDDGHCIYNGPTHGLIPFLSKIQLECPTTYNPADYILEIAQTNKKSRQLLINFSRMIEYEQTAQDMKFYDDVSTIKKANESLLRPDYWKQVHVLMHRGFLQMTRNKLNIFIQCLHFTMCGLVMGAVFFNFGNDAKHLFHNFMLCICMLVYLIFGVGMAPAIAYPSEFRLFKNEILNGWYSINAYFTQLSLICLPIPFVMSLVFCIITYFMTNQPYEVERFLKFYLIVILTIIISESHGKIIGICCPNLYGSILTPGTLAPIVALSFHGFGHARQLSKTTKILMETSFVRHSLVGSMVALYHNRDKMDCSEIYCHYSEPKLFLQDMGMIGTYEMQVVVLVAFVILYKSVVYVFLGVKIGLFKCLLSRY